MLTLGQARALLEEWTPGEALRRHARSVEIVMAKAAHRHAGGDADEQVFRIAGLLHDADYEVWPDEHPKRIVAHLQSLGENDIAHAIAGHCSHWGMTYDTPLDKALLACDEITGFVIACCLPRPDGILSLTPSSVIKKLKDKSFAAKVDRDEVKLGATLLGVELAEHIQLVIDALTPHAEELGIAGKRQGQEPL